MPPLLRRMLETILHGYETHEGERGLFVLVLRSPVRVRLLALPVSLRPVDVPADHRDVPVDGQRAVQGHTPVGEWRAPVEDQIPSPACDDGLTLGAERGVPRPAFEADQLSLSRHVEGRRGRRCAIPELPGAAGAPEGNRG